MLRFAPAPRTGSLCSRCRRRLLLPSPARHHAPRRRLATAAAPAPTSPSPHKTTPAWDPVVHGAPGAEAEDRTLRDIFDNPHVWRAFAQPHASTPRTGLFQNRDLTSPAGFQKYASRTLSKAQAVVARICSATADDELHGVVKELDYLSDLLCRVIDMCDFVRSTHPDGRVVAAANEAYATVFEYMNILNTTTGLYAALKRALASPAVVARWSEEEQAVARILYKDFEKSGINLPDAERKKFVDLSNEIAQLGHEFVNGMRPKRRALVFESSRLRGMDPMVVRELNRRGRVTLPTVGMPAHHALRTVEDEEVRRELYLASRTSDDDQIALLEDMLRRRAELARLVGRESYAEITLADKMASSPEAVSEFLSALSTANEPAALMELHTLASLKRERGNHAPLKPWDKDYYTDRLLTSLRSHSKSAASSSTDGLAAYFSLGTVLQGLSRLFSRLYGIRFVPTPTSPGETWNPDVRRLDVICEHTGHIAVVYCDLFSRPGKAPNPAHFTLRCSRRISQAEQSHAYALGEPADDGMASARRADDLYQLPTIALICDFPPAPAAQGKTLLSFREVATLFHEMGHAVHSMLGRTALHNVAGTRCATDWAELPSVLMEHFACAPEVLAVFARHHETDAPLPVEMLRERVRRDTVMEACETRAQIVLAVLDQAYHSRLAAESGFRSTDVYRKVLREYALLGEGNEETSWQGFFGHLYGYGATYYAYLFDRAIAAKVWGEVFSKDPLSREAGERFREEVLRWGGARAGWKCLAGLLRRPEMEEGGRESMKEVGRWGSELK